MSASCVDTDVAKRRLLKLVQAVRKTSTITGSAKREDFRDEEQCIKDVYNDMTGMYLNDADLDFILGNEK